MKDIFLEKFREKLQKLRDGGRSMQEEIREKTIGYILAGLGVVTGLAWNEAISTLIEYLFPLDKNTILAKFMYAILMTAVIVILSTYLVRLVKKK